MSVELPANLTLDLGRSRVLAGVFLALHGGTVVVAFLLPVSFAISVVVTSLVAVSCYRSLYIHAWRTAPTAVVAISVDPEGNCVVRRHGSMEWQHGSLVDRWVQPWFVILVIRQERKRKRISASVLIPADAVPAETFRRLRVMLRLQTAVA